MNQSDTKNIIEVTYSSALSTLGSVKWPQSSSVSLAQLPPLVNSLTTSLIVKIVLTGLGCIWNVAGNSLTLVAIRMTPRLRTKTDIILCSLTVADLFVAIDIVYYSVYMAIDRAFLNPCNFAVPMTIFSAFAKAPAYISSLHLIVAAVDRYVAVVHPFTYQDRLTDGVVRAMLAAAWIVGCLLGASHWMWLIDRKRRPICQIVSPAYSLLEIVLYVVVATTVTAMYGVILNVAWKHHVRIQSEMASVGNARYTSGASGVAFSLASTDNNHQLHDQQQCAKLQQLPGNWEQETSHDSTYKQPKVRRREFRAVYLTASVVCSYVVLWLPYTLGRALGADGRSDSYVATFVAVGGGFGILNSSFNWILYGAVSKKYRQAYWRLLSRCTSAVASNSVDGQK